jgi:hypothetical protein
VRRGEWLALMILAAAPLGGCFDLEESVKLERNLSGTATYRMTVDGGQVADAQADRLHAESGRPGAATKEERAAQRAEMAPHGDTGKPVEYVGNSSSQAMFASDLPAGVQLVDWTDSQHDLKMISGFKVRFDEALHLAKVALPPSVAGGMTGSPDQPFLGLKVVDEGPTLLVTLADARESVGAERGAAPASDPELDALFKNAHFLFRFESPFDVVETNATRREGRTLIWEYRGAALIAALSANPPTVLQARLKK